jgi:hypothetical protein
MFIFYCHTGINKRAGQLITSGEHNAAGRLKTGSGYNQDMKTILTSIVFYRQVLHMKQGVILF